MVHCRQIRGCVCPSIARSKNGGAIGLLSGIFEPGGMPWLRVSDEMPEGTRYEQRPSVVKVLVARLAE
jgi:hypothetical protein